MDAELEQPARLGPPARRPAGRPLRHGPAADRGRRPDDLRLLDRRRPRRPRRPVGLRQARRRHPDRRAALPTSRCSSTPTRRYPASQARRSSRVASSDDDRQRLRQRPPARRAPTGSATATLTALRADPAHRRADRAAGDPARRQPRRSRSTAPTGSTRGPRRRRRARAAADLPVVHPRGRPADAAAHRAHPRRRLPRRGRRGHRRGQQLPVQREPGRPAAPVHRTPRRRCRRFSREWGDYFPRTATPALRVPDFNMSTVSQAN